MPHTLPHARRLSTTLLAVAIVAAFSLPTAWGQFKLSDSLGKDLGSFGGFGAADSSSPVSVSAQFTVATADSPAVLIISAEIQPEWHVYALTQPPGGPQKAAIELEESSQFRLAGPFRAHPAPQSHIDEIAWVGLELQEHANQVTWYAPIEFFGGVDPQSVTIRGTVRGQACQDACVPLKLPFAAQVGHGLPIGELALHATPAELAAQPSNGAAASGARGPVQIASSLGFKNPGSDVVLRGQLVPAEVGPGETAELHLTAESPARLHVYELAEQDSKLGSKPTLITMSSTSGIGWERPLTTAPIVEVDQSAIGWEAARTHEGAVTWTVRLQVPADAQAGTYPISGIFGYQACESSENGLGSCELPQAARFDVDLQVAKATPPAGAAGSSVPVRFTTSKYATAASLAAGEVLDSGGGQPTTPSAPTIPALKPDPALKSGYDLQRLVIGESGGSVTKYVLLAFLGGIVLNLMPCVLPVIGLKIMSFVEQAGESRRRALMLNLWYSAGIVSVFLVLAGLAISAQYSWGAQFGSTTFNVILATIVFAMALCLLGVWEIPIPGFFGSGAAQELSSQEGPLGAFLKGVVTTVLATPCTGPFMASAIGWAVQQPPAVTWIVFASLGLGMASPYLLIGAFPGLIRFLPKPGLWMETFKQIMGFVLIGTVLFLLSFMHPAAVVPTVALLLGVGVACWVFSRTPLTAPLSERLNSWALGGAIVVAAAVFAFGFLMPDVTTPRFEARIARAAERIAGDVVVSSDEPWQSFSLDKLERFAVEEGRTVLVDFSAEWCLTCKTLEKTVLHTQPVQAAIEATDVVTMYADFTEYPTEIDEMLKALGSNGVPVIAIFPGSDPYNPIVFRGQYTRKGLVEALEQATGEEVARRKSPNAYRGPH